MFPAGRQYSTFPLNGKVVGDQIHKNIAIESMQSCGIERTVYHATGFVFYGVRLKV